MALFINIEELLQVEMCVFLSRGQAVMSQELLDNSEVSTSAKKMGGEGMAERMGTDLPPHRRKTDIFVHHSFY